MILPSGIARVCLAMRPVDFRQRHAGLAPIVQSVPGHDPYNGAEILFRSERDDQLKCPVRDQTGLILISQKLEGSAFHWPKPDDGVIRLSPAPFAALFAALFEGIDWRAVSAERRQRPRLAG